MHGISIRRLLAGAVLLLAALPVRAESATPNADALGWRLGVQAFSFYRVTLFEAIDNVSALGLGYIECMPFGRLSPEYPDVATNHTMSAEHRALLKAKLDSAGVTLVNYGVAELPNDEAACRAVFEFAKDMGIETINSEPPPEALDLVARLCDEYEINVGIHNHPTPSAYWDPQRVLEAVEGRTKRMGACADTSHWMRSGLDVVECLQLLEGRIKCFHFGEVSGEELEAFAARRDGKSEDDADFPTMVQHVQGIPNIVYGTGPADMRAWLAEIHRQGIQAVFSIEAFFHLSPGEAMEQMKPSIAYFESVAAELRAGDGE